MKSYLKLLHNRKINRIEIDLFQFIKYDFLQIGKHRYDIVPAETFSNFKTIRQTLFKTLHLAWVFCPLYIYALNANL